MSWRDLLNSDPMKDPKIPYRAKRYYAAKFFMENIAPDPQYSPGDLAEIKKNMFGQLIRESHPEPNSEYIKNQKVGLGSRMWSAQAQRRDQMSEESMLWWQLRQGDLEGASQVAENLRSMRKNARDYAEDTSAIKNLLVNTSAIAPDMITGWAGRTVGAAVGTAVGGPTGGVIGGLGGGSFPMYMQGVADFYIDMTDNGVNPELARSLSLEAAIPYAAIESLNIMLPTKIKGADGAVKRRMLKGLTDLAVERLKKGGKRAASKTAIGAVKYGAGVLGESGEETGQEILKNWATEVGLIIQDVYGDEALSAFQKLTSTLRQSADALGQEVQNPEAWKAGQEAVGPMALLGLGGSVANKARRVDGKETGALPLPDKGSGSTEPGREQPSAETSPELNGNTPPQDENALTDAELQDINTEVLQSLADADPTGAVRRELERRQQPKPDQKTAPTAQPGETVPISEADMIPPAPGQEPSAVEQPKPKTIGELVEEELNRQQVARQPRSDRDMAEEILRNIADNLGINPIQTMSLEELEQRLRDRDIIGEPEAAEAMPEVRPNIEAQPGDIVPVAEADTIPPAEPVESEAQPEGQLQGQDSGVIANEPQKIRETTEQEAGQEPAQKQPWEMTQEEFRGAFLMSGVVDASLVSRYATDRPEMAAHFSEDMRAIPLDRAGQPGDGVVRIYPRAGARWTTNNEYVLPEGASAIAEINAAEARHGAHKTLVRRAFESGQPIPRAVLEDYRGEAWADEALAKMDAGQNQPQPNQPQPMKEPLLATPLVRSQQEIQSLPLGAVYRIVVGGRERFAVRGERESGYGDSLFDTEQDAKQEAELVKKIPADRAKSEAAEAARKDARQQEKYEKNDIDGFAEDRPDVVRKRIVATLNKYSNSDGEVTSRKQHIRNAVRNGVLSVETQPDGKLRMVRSDGRVEKAGGGYQENVEYYWSMGAPKIEAEYAQHLLDQQAQPQGEPEQPVSEKEPQPVSAPKPIEEGAVGRDDVVAESPDPRQVYSLPISDLNMDENRFQFRPGGSTTLSDAKKFDPDWAGVIHVWRDPKDNKVYVVNGHNRYRKAISSGYTGNLNVQYLEADTAGEARQMGALQNIADGNVTALDVATFLRESGYDPNELIERGLSMKKKEVWNGINISKLDDTLYEAWQNGIITDDQAGAIGHLLGDKPAKQRALFSQLQKSGDISEVGKSEITQAIKFMDGTPALQSSEQTLFGEEITEYIPVLEKASISEYIKRQLSTDKKVFGSAARNKELLEKGENTINEEKSSQIATRAKRLYDLFRDIVDNNFAGEPVLDVLNQAAADLAQKKGNANETKQRAAEEVLRILEADPRVAKRGTGIATEEATETGDVPEGGLFGERAAQDDQIAPSVQDISGPMLDQDAYAETLREVAGAALEGFEVRFVSQEEADREVQARSRNIRLQSGQHAGAFVDLKRKEVVVNLSGPQETAAHEAGHILLALHRALLQAGKRGIFTRAEWLALQKEFPALNQNDQGGILNRAAEEAALDRLMEMAKAGAVPRGPLSRIVQRIGEFLRKMANRIGINLDRNLTAEDVLKRFLTGEIGRRAIGEKSETKGTGVLAHRKNKAHEFVYSPDGQIDFGQIPEGLTIPTGKIRLQRGWQDNLSGSGFGLTHIENIHGQDIRGLGFYGAEHFVKHIIEKAIDIRQDFDKRRRINKITIAAKNGRYKVAVLELRKEMGGFYSVVTAYPLDSSQRLPGRSLLGRGPTSFPSGPGSTGPLKLSVPPKSQGDRPSGYTGVRSDQPNVNNTQVDKDVNGDILPSIQRLDDNASAISKGVEQMFDESRQQALAQERAKYKPHQMLAAMRRMVWDRSGNIRTALKKSGKAGQHVARRFQAISGASPKAAYLIDQAQKKIYKGLSRAQEETLSRIIAARRVIAIDQHQDELKANARAEIKRINDAFLDWKKNNPMGQAGFSLDDYFNANPEDQAQYDWAKEAIQKPPVKHPKGYTQNDMKAYLSEVERSIGADAFEKINQRAEKYFDVMRDQLDQLHEHGLITSRELELLRNAGEYSPRQFLDVLDPVRTYDVGGGTPLSIHASGLKPMKGGSEGLLETDSRLLLAEVVNRTQGRIARNQANQAAYTLAATNQQQPVFFLPKGKKPRGMAEIDVMIAGKKKSLWVPNEMAEEWVAGSPHINRMATSIIGWSLGTIPLKMAATGYNPGFAVTNLPRDLAYIFARSTQYSSHLPVYAAQMAADLAATAKDAFLRRGDFAQFVLDGGMMDFLSHQGRAEVSRRHEGMRVASKIGSYLGETSELWTRLAHRRRAMRNGESAFDAAQIARETLDFSQGGVAAKYMDVAVPYLNASIQATRGLVESAKDNPGVLAWKMAQVGALAFGLAMAAAKLYPDDWEDIPDYEKRRKWIIPLPAVYVDQNGIRRRRYIRIPKDQGQQWVASIFEGLAMKALGREYDWNNATSAAGEMVKLNVADLPPALDAIMGYLNNKDFWTHEDIWKGADVEPEAEHYGSTNRAAVAAGEATGLSPVRLQYAAEQVLAPNSNIFTAMMGEGLHRMAEEFYPEGEERISRDLDRIPMARRLLGTTRPEWKDKDRREQAVRTENTRRLEQNRELDRAFKDGLSSAMEYVAEQPFEDQHRLRSRAMRMKKIEGVPNRYYWLDLAEMPPIQRAREFIIKYKTASEDEQKELLRLARRVPGVGSRDFWREFYRVRRR